MFGPPSCCKWLFDSLQNSVTASCSRSCWKNCGRTVGSPLCVSLKLEMFNMAITAIIRFRTPRWPCSSYKAKSRDVEQRHMLRISCPLRRLGTRTDLAYFRRAAHAILDLQVYVVPWGLSWAVSVITWAAHALRISRRPRGVLGSCTYDRPTN